MVNARGAIAESLIDRFKDTSQASGSPSKTSRSSSTAGRPSSSTSSRLYGECPTAMPSRTASWRDLPAIRGLSALPGRSARTTASGSSSRATASSPPTASARTPHSAPTTSGVCSPSRVSLSDDLRHELAAITPRSSCDRLAELSGLFHSAGSEHLKGRGEVSVHLDVVDPAVARRAFSLLRAFGVGSEIRTYRRRAFEGGTRYQLHVAGDDRALQVLNEAGVLELTVDAARAPAQACRRTCVLSGGLPPWRPPWAAGSLSGPRSPHLEIRSAELEGAKFLSRVAEEEGARLSVLDRGRHAVAYAKGLEAIADIARTRRCRASRSLIRRASRHGGDEVSRQPARERRPCKSRPHEPCRPRTTAGRRGPASYRSAPEAVAAVAGDRGAARASPNAAAARARAQMPSSGNRNGGPQTFAEATNNWHRSDLRAWL